MPPRNISLFATNFLSRISCNWVHNSPSVSLCRKPRFCSPLQDQGEESSPYTHSSHCQDLRVPRTQCCSPHSGDLELRQLSQTFSKDISLLQDQVADLERLVDSLAEVAVQNRRGLDLLFLRKEELCAALEETYCFYANHLGIIRDSIKVLTKRLKEQEKLEKPTQYTGICKMSPQLTTLISSISRLLLIILLFNLQPHRHQYDSRI